MLTATKWFERKALEKHQQDDNMKAKGPEIIRTHKLARSRSSMTAIEAAREISGLKLARTKDSPVAILLTLLSAKTIDAVASLMRPALSSEVRMKKYEATVNEAKRIAELFDSVYEGDAREKLGTELP